MRGHGSVVVGASAEEAFFACTFLEENSQIQLQAELHGPDFGLSEEEARDCRTGTFNQRLFGLLWDFYDRKAALPNE
jgi:ribulose-5-phosphate 4-epimerase/fuculose-1-phosphate aldolase